MNQMMVCVCTVNNRFQHFLWVGALKCFQDTGDFFSFRLHFLSNNQDSEKKNFRLCTHFAHLTIVVLVVESDHDPELEAVGGGEGAQRLQRHARQIEHQRHPTTK